MKKSKNAEVQNWLDELKQFDKEKYAIVTSARQIVHTAYPQVLERIIYGGIMFTLDTDIGGLFVSKHHVSFEFSDGYQFTDPNQLLEGSGKFRRHLKLKQKTDVLEKEVAYFVSQAVAK